MRARDEERDIRDAGGVDAGAWLRSLQRACERLRGIEDAGGGASHVDPAYLESLRRRRRDGSRIISGMLVDETIDCRVYETMWAHYIEAIPWSALPHCLGCSLSTVKRLRRRGERYVADVLSGR